MSPCKYEAPEAEHEIQLPNLLGIDITAFFLPSAIVAALLGSAGFAVAQNMLVRSIV